MFFLTLIFVLFSLSISIIYKFAQWRLFGKLNFFMNDYVHFISFMLITFFIENDFKILARNSDLAESN